ncbi:peptide synthetase [Fusarium denticulatum]|uniref:Peptide synthetase n=1 Tax=Fusarium denticulatum TaxID=48507 RepID=A0A8H5U807_9HYPO|nr:peptide synthetase [Fusarium denticulatum]
MGFIDEPHLEPHASSFYKTEIEDMIGAVVTEVVNLPLERFLLHRSFVAFGGDSVSTMAVVARSRSRGIRHFGAEKVAVGTGADPVNDIGLQVTDVRRVKDIKRSIPHKGLPYFVHRYLTEEGRVAFKYHDDMEILFNCSGHWGLDVIEAATLRSPLQQGIPLSKPKQQAKAASQSSKPKMTCHACYRASGRSLLRREGLQSIWDNYKTPCAVSSNVTRSSVQLSATVAQMTFAGIMERWKEPDLPMNPALLTSTTSPCNRPFRTGLIHWPTQARAIFQFLWTHSQMAGEGELSYVELDDYAAWVSVYLHDLGVRPEVMVPLIFTKSIWMIVSMLAVMKVGGATVAVTSADRIVLISGLVDNAVALNTDGAACVAKDADGDSELPLDAATPDDAVYIIFTSGSSG